jgi:hypothetical protein
VGVLFVLILVCFLIDFIVAHLPHSIPQVGLLLHRRDGGCLAVDYLD